MIPLDRSLIKETAHRLDITNPKNPKENGTWSHVARYIDLGPYGAEGVVAGEIIAESALLQQAPIKGFFTKGDWQKLVPGETPKNQQEKSLSINAPRGRWEFLDEGLLEIFRLYGYGSGSTWHERSPEAKKEQEKLKKLSFLDSVLYHIATQKKLVRWDPSSWEFWDAAGRRLPVGVNLEYYSVIKDNDFNLEKAAALLMVHPEFGLVKGSNLTQEDRSNRYNGLALIAQKPMDAVTPIPYYNRDYESDTENEPNPDGSKEYADCEINYIFRPSASLELVIEKAYAVYMENHPKTPLDSYVEFKKTVARTLAADVAQSAAYNPEKVMKAACFEEDARSNALTRRFKEVYAIIKAEFDATRPRAEQDDAHSSKPATPKRR